MSTYYCFTNNAVDFPIFRNFQGISPDFPQKTDILVAV